jgi:tetratricopeptide (TPR) repeat protein
MRRRSSLVAVCAALVSAWTVHVAAQEPAEEPGVEEPPEAEILDPDEDGAPIDPSAQTAPPRPLVVGGDLPEVPAKAPDRIAAMAFENRSGVHALDWMTAGVPLTLAEKVEQEIGLQPAYDEWVVPVGRVVRADAASVEAFADEHGARWVWTGWVERPNWQLRMAIALWRVDPGAKAVRVGEVEQLGQFGDVHAMVGVAAGKLLGDAGIAISDAQKAALGAVVSKDLYAFTLLGRGVARVRGTLGKVDLDGAERDLERAIFIEPTMAVGQRLVGELWLDYPTGDKPLPADPRDAAKAVARAAARAGGKFAYAVDLAPRYVPALRASATAARQAGKPEVARELYDRLVRLRPWDLDARVYLGEALWQTGEPEGALRELLRVTKRSPDDLRARRLIALVHSDRGDLEALVVALEEIARRAPEDLDVRMDLGAAYSALGRWDDARASYVAVATARPADATVLKLAGDVERRRGDPVAAAAWYAQMEKAAPEDPRPPFLIGQTWLASGDLDKAYRAFVRAQKHRDWVAQAFTALGAVQYRSGKIDEALWYLRRAAQRRPHLASARLALARVLIAKQQGAPALVQVAAARTLGAEGAEVDYLAALAHANAGDFDAARAAIKLAVTADGGLGEARRAQLAIDKKRVPELEGAPEVDIPFGDIDAYEAAIDAFLAADAAMAAVRKALDDQYLAALAAMGEGPGKDLSKEARRRPRSRTCPLAQVAKPTIAARKLEKELTRRGLVLEQVYRRVASADSLGESVGLTPAYRRKVAEVRVAWRRALVGVREIRSELQVGLGRELKARRCRDDLLAAAAARPDLYGAPGQVAPKVGPEKAEPRKPLTATLYIDNRECTDPIQLWIDGELIGEALPGQRSAFEASVGQRSLCLLVPGEAGACGDRGTVRQAYLHDGWSTLVHCRGAAARSAP